MNYGIIPENLLERAALWLGRVPVPLVDALFGPLKARVIMTGVTVGLFEALRDGPRPVPELAGALGADADCLELLARALAHIGYLEQKGRLFALSPLSRRTMVRGAEAELTGYQQWNVTQWRFLEHLETLVRTGKGLDFHQTLTDADAWGHYQRAMYEAARFDAALIARLVPVRKGSTRLVDLGGSHGLLGAAICRRYPPLRSTVVDLPPAIDHGRALAAEAGHDDIVEHRAGDLLTVRTGPADVVLLANVLHHFEPAQAREVLARAFADLTPDGTVAIWDVEAPPRGSRAGHGDLAALYFRLTSTSDTYHGSQYAAWLAEAGFRGVHVIRPRLAPGRVLVIARR